MTSLSKFFFIAILKKTSSRIWKGKNLGILTMIFGDNYMYSGEKYADYYTFLLFVLLNVQVAGFFLLLFFLLPYILFIHK